MIQTDKKMKKDAMESRSIDSVSIFFIIEGGVL